MMSLTQESREQDPKSNLYIRDDRGNALFSKQVQIKMINLFNKIQSSTSLIANLLSTVSITPTQLKPKILNGKLQK